MPIYEYRCQSCAHEFEELVYASDTPECPRCHTTKLEKLVSTPSVGKSEQSAAPVSGCCGGCEHSNGGGGCGLD